MLNFPEWLKKRLPPVNEGVCQTNECLDKLRVNTICQKAACPNIVECFEGSTAAFLILGNICTRNCFFCQIQQGTPLPPDPDEPWRVAKAAQALNLEHVVITSVTRDDLSDGGASYFAACIFAIRQVIPLSTVEVLIPDLEGNLQALGVVLEASPCVLNHNIETVPRLYPQVKPRASYKRSLEVLTMAAQQDPKIIIKSGIMVGFGESPIEVEEVLADLAKSGVSAVTIGQYLPPTPLHLTVSEYVTPKTFAFYDRRARELGLDYVISGPFVRSSYHAGELIIQMKEGKKNYGDKVTIPWRKSK